MCKEFWSALLSQHLKLVIAPLIVPHRVRFTSQAWRFSVSPIRYLRCVANLNAWAAFANYKLSRDHWKRPLFFTDVLLAKNQLRSRMNFETHRLFEGLEISSVTNILCNSVETYNLVTLSADRLRNTSSSPVDPTNFTAKFEKTICLVIWSYDLKRVTVWNR